MKRLMLGDNGVSDQFSSVAQSCPTLCDPMNHSTPGLLSITNSRSSLRLTSIESVTPSSHLILCPPLLLLPPIPPSIRVFSNESTLCMRRPKYWNFSFSIIPSKEIPGLISFKMDLLDLLAVKGLSSVFSNTTVQKHQFLNICKSLYVITCEHVKLLQSCPRICLQSERPGFCPWVGKIP